ncbi:MAG: caspase domain-containing protein [Phenylobacterium sp.]
MSIASKPMLRLSACLLVALSLVCVAIAPKASAQAAPARRIALVMGNATYTNGGVLDNPENDADAVTAKLTSLGFEVTEQKNLGQAGMRTLLGSFMSKVRDGDLVLVYYAGHGIEVDGRDYMLPVDVNLDTPASVQFQGIPIDMAYSAKATFGLVIVFDACRDNPFLRRVGGDVPGTHSVSPPVGSMVLFSAATGQVAQDGPVATQSETRKNSVFADALLTALSTPGASLGRIYQITLKQVRLATDNRQAPQRFGDLAEDFIFNPGGSQVAAAYSAPPPPPPAPAPPVQVAAATPPPEVPGQPAGATYRSAPLNAPAATPPPAPAPAAPIVVATASPPPPPAAPVARAESRLASGPSPVASFEIASLGENVLPPPPPLAAVPPVNIPASFCRIEDEIAFLKDVFQPAYNVAYKNNQLAIAYLSGLIHLGEQYKARQSGFVFQIKDQFERFAPVAAHANDESNSTLGLDARIRAVPVGGCSK